MTYIKICGIREPQHALSAILAMGLTFFIASILSLAVLGSARIINFFELKPQITAFLRYDAKQEDIDNLKNQLNETEKVSSVRFVSKEEVLEIYKEQNKHDPLLLDLVTTNILPALLEVSATNVSELATLADIVRNSSAVEEVVFQKDIVDTLTSWTNAIRMIGLGFVLVLTAVSILTIIMVIGMKISRRHEEIEIMRLVGASFWFIRWPFIIEGAIYGVLGATIAWAFSYAIILYAAPFLKSFLSGIPLLPVHPLFMLALLGTEVLTAALLGAFASFLGVLRYLKKEIAHDPS